MKKLLIITKVHSVDVPEDKPIVVSYLPKEDTFVQAGRDCRDIPADAKTCVLRPLVFGYLGGEKLVQKTLAIWGEEDTVAQDLSIFINTVNRDNATLNARCSALAETVTRLRKENGKLCNEKDSMILAIAGKEDRIEIVRKGFWNRLKFVITGDM